MRELEFRRPVGSVLDKMSKSKIQGSICGWLFVVTVFCFCCCCLVGWSFFCCCFFVFVFFLGFFFAVTCAVEMLLFLMVVFWNVPLPLTPIVL